MGIAKSRRYCYEEDRMVLAERPTPNHILHLLLSVVTAGLWIIVWIILTIGADFNSYKCPSCGGNTDRKPPRGWKPRRRRDEYDDDED